MKCLDFFESLIIIRFFSSTDLPKEHSEKCKKGCENNDHGVVDSDTKMRQTYWVVSKDFGVVSLK